MDPRPLTTPAVLVAAAAAHTAWVLGPWGRGALPAAWAVGASVAITGLLAVALARHALWPLLAMPLVWALMAPTMAGLPAAVALITLGCHLAVSLAWRAAGAPGSEDPVEWTTLSEQPRDPRGAPTHLGAGPWAAAPIAAIAGALVSPQALGAARLAWSADPGRALAGVGAAGLAGGLLFAAAAGRPRLALRGSAIRAAWLGVHALVMLGLWWWVS